MKNSFQKKKLRDILLGMNCRITAVVNQKGGVGKTTTVVNLSSFLAELGKRVLVVDFDPQANATSALGLKKDALNHTIYDVLKDNTPAFEAIHPTPFENLHILPTSNDLAGAEVELAGAEGREYFLQKTLLPLTNYYDYIIIDCAPSLGLLTVNALVAAREILIPVQCEYFALEGLAHLINTLNLVKKNINPKLSVSGILLTMYDPRTSLNRSVVHDTKSYFKNLVFDTIIPRNIRLAEAPSYGLPIALYNPTSKGSYSYQKLAKEFMSRVN